MKKLYGRVISVVLAIMMAVGTPVSALAISPPPVSGLPIVSGETSDTSSEPDEFIPPQEEPSGFEPLPNEAEPDVAELPDTPSGELQEYPVTVSNYRGGQYRSAMAAAEEVSGVQQIQQWGMYYTHPYTHKKMEWCYAQIVVNGVAHVAYCVDITATASNTGTRFESTYTWNNLGSDADAKRASISHIMHYGAQSSSEPYKYIAAQCLIWEIVYGNRAPGTFAEQGGAYDFHGIAKELGASSAYDSILASVIAWAQVPSFASNLRSKAPTHKLSEDGDGFSVTLKNTNSAAPLSNFSFPSGNGVTFSKSGESLTVKTGENPPTEVITATKGDPRVINPVVFWIDNSSKEQTRATFVDDPVPCYFKVSVDGASTPENPEITDYYIDVEKLEAGTDAPLAGAQFEIRYLGGNGEIVIPPPVTEPSDQDNPDTEPETPPVTEPEHHFVTTVTSGGDGHAKVQVPYAGVYQITEQVPPVNHKLAEEAVQTVTVNKDTPNGTAHVTYHNEPFTGVLVRKIDARTSQPVAGATICLEQIDGDIAMEGITGTDGTYLFEPLPANSYRIFEKYAPESYVINTSVYTVEARPNQTVEVVIPNTPKPGLIIRKVDQDGNPLQGALFEIKEKDGPLICEKISDQNGLIVLQDLPKKWLTVTEKQPPAHHLLDPDNTSRDVNMLDGHDQEIVFRNPKKPSLLLEKVDAAHPGIKLAGAVFRISVEDSADYTEVTTGPDGTALLEDLPETWLTVWEVTAPDGYLLSTEKRIVEVAAGKVTKFVWENSRKPSLEIIKTDKLTGQPVPNCKFEIRIKNGKILGDYLTNEEGRILLEGVEPALYVITELSCKGYHLLTEPIEILVERGAAVTVPVENDPENPLLIYKIDAKTGEPVSGAKFSVSRVNGTFVGEYTSGRNGYCTVSGQQPGFFVVKEIEAAPGYILNGTPKTVELKRDAEPAIVEFENTPLVGLQLRKLDAVSGKQIPNVRFVFKELDGRLIGSYSTDSTGTIYIPGLREGWLEYYEESPAEGYKPDSTPRRFEVKADKLNVIEAVNYPWPTLTITKTDQEGKPLPGVGITLFDSYNRELGTFTTSKTGKIVLTGIDAGDYYCQETSTIEGYELNKTVYPVTLEWGRDTPLLITNKPLATFRLRKIDAETKAPVYGTGFLLTDAKNNIIGEYATDQNGLIELTQEIAAQKIKVKEIRASKGYVLDETVRTVTLKAGETTELVWENEPERGQIQIIKTSSEYNDMTKLSAGSMLRGAVFEIFDQSHTVVDRIVSDYRGIALSKPLPLGIYGIREIASPKFYQKTNKVFWAELKIAGDLVKFRVENANEELSVNVQKIGNIEAMPGDVIRYDFKQIQNASTVSLDRFYWRDIVPTDAVRLEKIATGTWSEKLAYSVSYKTNIHDYRILADDLNTQISSELDCSQSALGLDREEYVTEVRFDFGTVQPGFTQNKAPAIFCKVLDGLENEYRFRNCTDVGGQRQGEWILAKDCWTTIVYSLPKGKLPKTGM